MVNEWVVDQLVRVSGQRADGLGDSIGDGHLSTNFAVQSILPFPNEGMVRQRWLTRCASRERGGHVPEERMVTRVNFEKSKTFVSFINGMV